MNNQEEVVQVHSDPRRDSLPIIQGFCRHRGGACDTAPFTPRKMRPRRSAQALRREELVCPALHCVPGTPRAKASAQGVENRGGPQSPGQEGAREGPLAPRTPQPLLGSGRAFRGQRLRPARPEDCTRPRDGKAVNQGAESREESLCLPGRQDLGPHASPGWVS